MNTYLSYYTLPAVKILTMHIRVLMNTTTFEFSTRTFIFNLINNTKTPCAKF